MSGIQQASRICLSLPPNTEITGAHLHTWLVVGAGVGVGDLNSEPHPCTASALPTGLCHQPYLFKLMMTGVSVRLQLLSLELHMVLLQSYVLLSGVS